MMKRQGTMVEKGTRGTWVGKATQVLFPLSEVMLNNPMQFQISPQ
jgi:hypothetical protein